MNGIHKRRRGEERGNETEEAHVRTKVQLHQDALSYLILSTDFLNLRKSVNFPNGVGSRNHFSDDKTSSILSGLESIHELYSDSADANIWGIAQRDLDKV